MDEIQRLRVWLDGEAFDRVMSRYRHAPATNPTAVLAAFTAVKIEIMRWAFASRPTTSDPDHVIRT